MWRLLYHIVISAEIPAEEAASAAIAAE